MAKRAAVEGKSCELTMPVALLEAGRAGRLSAQAAGPRAAAAPVAVRVLQRVLRRGDVEGGVAGVHCVAFGVGRRVTQVVVWHGRLC